jgi:hypothetical protein
MRRYLSYLRYVCRPEDELGKSYKPLSINVFKAHGVDFEFKGGVRFERITGVCSGYV